MTPGVDLLLRSVAELERITRGNIRNPPSSAPEAGGDVHLRRRRLLSLVHKQKPPVVGSPSGGSDLSAKTITVQAGILDQFGSDFKSIAHSVRAVENTTRSKPVEAPGTDGEDETR